MKRIATALVVTLLMAGCTAHHPPAPKPHVPMPSHGQIIPAQRLDDGSYVYPYRSPIYGDTLWYYFWLTPAQSSTSATTTSIAAYSSHYSPNQMGRTVVSSPKEEPMEVETYATSSTPRIIAPAGKLEEEDAAEDRVVSEENSEIDVENAQAVESFENEGGRVAPEPENEAPPAEAESASSESSSSDSGSSGGDGGGGGGD